MQKRMDFANRLMTMMWRTSGARFNAARRFRLRDKLSTFSISAFSLAGIILSVVAIIYGLPNGPPGDNFTLLALAISQFVLVISLLEGSASYQLRAERLHINAVQIAAERSNLELAISSFIDGNKKSANKFQEIMDRYEHLIRECPENHSPLDDMLFLVQHRNSGEFKEKNISTIKSIYVRIIYYGSSIWLFSIFWVVIGVCIYLVLRR